MFEIEENYNEAMWMWSVVVNSKLIVLNIKVKETEIMVFIRFPANHL